MDKECNITTARITDSQNNLVCEHDLADDWGFKFNDRGHIILHFPVGSDIPLDPITALIPETGPRFTDSENGGTVIEGSFKSVTIQIGHCVFSNFIIYGIEKICDKNSACKQVIINALSVENVTKEKLDIWLS
jgi:hypothetical protein